MKKFNKGILLAAMLLCANGTAFSQVPDKPANTKATLVESELKLVEPLSQKSLKIVQGINTEKQKDLTILITQATKELANMRSAMAHCPKEPAQVAKRLDRGLNHLITELKRELPAEVHPLFDEVFNKYRKGSAEVYKSKTNPKDNLAYCEKMTENEKGKQATYDLILEEFKAIVAEEKSENN